MASEEEVTQVANVEDTIELTQDKDVADSHEGNEHDSISHEEGSTKHSDVPNATADLPEVEPESALDNAPPPLPIEESTKELTHENTVEVKEPPSEDVESVRLHYCVSSLTPALMK